MTWDLRGLSLLTDVGVTQPACVERVAREVHAHCASVINGPLPSGGRQSASRFADDAAPV
jgi:hypothetical protein